MNSIENILRQNIVIDENTHMYFLDGVAIDMPSVSKIMELIPEYIFDCSFIEDEAAAKILEAGITRGIHLHKTAEIYIKTNIAPTCCSISSHNNMRDNLIYQLNLLKRNYPKHEGWEFISELSIIGDSFTGTMDFLLINKNTKEYIIGDLKTTKYLNKNKEALQVCLYDHLLNHRFKELNFDNFTCKGFFVFNCNLNNNILYYLDKITKEKAIIEKEFILEQIKD